MPLIRKPHSAQVMRVSGVVVGGKVLRYERTAGNVIGGQLAEKSAREIQSMFGVESQRPAVFFMDLSCANHVKAGDHLLVSGREYRVLTDAQLLDAEEVTSHARIALERLD